MIKFFTRTLFFTVVLTATGFLAKAQIGYDYAQYDLGLGGNVNRVYGDAELIKNTPSITVNFNYNYTPFVNYIAELQVGKLEGGHELTKSGRYFRNNYTALVFRGQLQAGEFLDYSRSGLMNGLKNLYISSGFGYLINDIRDINRESIITPGFYTGGQDKSKELFIPARIGYEFKVFNKYDQPSFKVDIGAQYDFVFGDNMDGFEAGKSKDKLIQYSIAFKFALGGVTSYRKQIHF